MSDLSKKDAEYIDELTELIDLVRRQYTRSLREDWLFSQEFGSYKWVPVSREWIERAEKFLWRKTH
tara:strand:- start:10476 stop:10673 length:198 start_codon:yes stop_codon:yes gene_type:complete